MEHICEICGKQFKTRGNKPRRVCSKKCYGVLLKQIHADKHPEKQCKICGKMFKPRLLACGRYSEAETCSPECALKYSEQTCMNKFGTKNASQADCIKEKVKQTNLERYGVDYPLKNTPHKEKETEPAQFRICEECGKKYWWEQDQPSYFENSQYVSSKRFCSYECGMKNKYDKVRATYQNKTEEEKLEYSSKIIERMSKRTADEIEKTNKKRECTCIEKYGAKTYLSSSEGMLKIKEAFDNRTPKEWEEIKKKVQSTKLIKYGNPHYIATDKIKETKEKHVAEDPEYFNKIKAKQKSTCMKRYGFPSASMSPEFKERKLKNWNAKSDEEKRNIVQKAKQTLIARYGKDYGKVISEKASETSMKRYGMKAILLPKVRNSSHAVFSKVNVAFGKFLKENEIEYSIEFPIKRYSYDFKVGNNLIEINPTVTHFSTDTKIWKFGPKLPDYHQNKTLLARENGYHCIHVWDWDDEDKIVSLLKPKETLYARNLVIGEISLKETVEFLNKYHLQGSCNKQEVRLGLYRDSELIEMMTFGKPRYSKKYEWELLRLCTKTGYKVVGGAERLFKCFVDKYNPTSIVSYCDNSKFTGEVYLKLGMKLKSFGAPSKHWYNPMTDRHITDNLLRQRGYSQLHNDTIHKKGESNELLMLEAGYLEIYDAGQSTYIWNK